MSRASIRCMGVYVSGVFASFMSFYLSFLSPKCLRLCASAFSSYFPFRFWLSWSLLVIVTAFVEFYLYWGLGLVGIKVCGVCGLLKFDCAPDGLSWMGEMAQRKRDDGACRQEWRR
ncbi:hypothetical protein BDZ91DRAFT_715415 [Kalaharituber pfeilii]|nr:hypothetical protein BDZ91DRAFT_715415 [Kalaharituber pfeilii]